MIGRVFGQKIGGQGAERRGKESGERRASVVEDQRRRDGVYINSACNTRPSIQYVHIVITKKISFMRFKGLFGCVFSRISGSKFRSLSAPLLKNTILSS
jgi:hypothetical protein